MVKGCAEAYRWVGRLKKTYQPVEGFPDKIDSERVEGFKRILDTLLQHCGNVNGKSFLDVGSNLGYFCLELAKRGAKTLGIERDKRRIQVAQCLAEKNGLDGAAFHCGDVLPFVEDNEVRYDYVILLNVFHHLLVQDEGAGWRMFNKLIDVSGGVFVMMRNSLKGWSLCDTEQGIPQAVLGVSDATDFVTYPAVHGRVIYFFWKC